MIASTSTATERRGELDLLTIWQVVFRHRYVVALTTALCFLGSLVFALTATPIFRAEVVVTEAREGAFSDTDSLLTRFGGLASLAGVDLTSAGPTREAKAVLESSRLVREFVSRNDLLSELLSGSDTPPTLWRAVRQFEEDVVSIEDDALKGTTTVVIEWTDAATAARWANGFVALSNELLRTRALNEAKRNIDYLNDQIKRTNVVELRRVMYSLIETETKTLMLANGRVEYAFTVVDPAVPPEVRASPRRTIIVLLGSVFGLFLGVLAAFGADARQRHRRGISRTP